MNGRRGKSPEGGKRQKIYGECLGARQLGCALCLAANKKAKHGLFGLVRKNS